ncbi:hypothetical protein E1289_17505 [Actinomadura sp. 6K520]|nr:hypothetical protein E1289_17505 [Actinomadura sp. 6K520]
MHGCVGRRPRWPAGRDPHHGPSRRALDNAPAEAVNSTLRVECVRWQRFATKAESRLKIAIWNTGFYNVRRRHSANDKRTDGVRRTHAGQRKTAEAGYARAEVGYYYPHYQGIDIPTGRRRSGPPKGAM